MRSSTNFHRKGIYISRRTKKKQHQNIYANGIIMEKNRITFPCIKKKNTKAHTQINVLLKNVSATRLEWDWRWFRRRRRDAIRYVYMYTLFYLYSHLLYIYSISKQSIYSSSHCTISCPHVKCVIT